MWSSAPGAPTTGAGNQLRGGHTSQFHAPRSQCQQFGPGGIQHQQRPHAAAGFNPRPPRPMGQQQQGGWQQAGPGPQTTPASWNTVQPHQAVEGGSMHVQSPSASAGGVNSSAQAKQEGVLLKPVATQAQSTHFQPPHGLSQSPVPSATSSTDPSFSSSVSRDPSPLVDPPKVNPVPMTPVKPESKEIGVDTADLGFIVVPRTQSMDNLASTTASKSLGLAAASSSTATRTASPPSHLSAALGLKLAAPASPATAPTTSTLPPTAPAEPPTTTANVPTPEPTLPTPAPVPARVASPPALAPARPRSSSVPPRRGPPTQFLYSRTHMPLPARLAVARTNSQHDALLGTGRGSMSVGGLVVPRPGGAATAAMTGAGRGGNGPLVPRGGFRPSMGRGGNGPLVPRGGFRPGFQGPPRGRGGMVATPGGVAGRGRGTPVAAATAGANHDRYGVAALNSSVGSMFSNPKSAAPPIHTLGPQTQLPHVPVRKSAWKGPVKYIEFDEKPASSVPEPTAASTATESAPAATRVLSDDEVSWTSSEEDHTEPRPTLPSVPPKISAWKGPVYIHPPAAASAAADWSEEDGATEGRVDEDGNTNGRVVSEGDDEDGWSDVTDQDLAEQQHGDMQAQEEAADVGSSHVDASAADNPAGVVEQVLVDQGDAMLVQDDDALDRDQHTLDQDKDSLDQGPPDAQGMEQTDAGPPVGDLLGLNDTDHPVEVNELTLTPPMDVDAFWHDQQPLSPSKPWDDAPQQHSDERDSSSLVATDQCNVYNNRDLQRPYNAAVRPRYKIERRVLPSATNPAPVASPPNLSSPAWSESTASHDQHGNSPSFAPPVSPPRTSPSAYQYRGFNSQNARSTWNGPQSRPGNSAHDVRPFAHNIKPLPLIGLGSSSPATDTVQEMGTVSADQHAAPSSEVTANSTDTDFAWSGGARPYVPLPPTNPKYGNRPFYGVPRARPGSATAPQSAQPTQQQGGNDPAIDQPQTVPSSPPVGNRSSPSGSPRGRSVSSSSFTRYYQDYRLQQQRADDEDNESVDLNLWSAEYHRRMQSRSRPRTDFSLSLPEQEQGDDSWDGTSCGSDSDDEASDAPSQEEGPVLLAPRPPPPRQDRRSNRSLRHQYGSKGANAASASTYRPQLTASMSSWIQPKAAQPGGSAAIQRHQRFAPTPRVLDENGDQKPLCLTDLPYDILHLIVFKYASSLAPAPFFLWAPSQTSSSLTLAIPVPTLSPGDCSCVPWWAATDDPERRWPYPTHPPPVVPDVETLLVLAKAHPRLMTACLPFMARHVQMPATEMQLAKRPHGPWLVTIHSQQWAMSEGGLYLKTDLTAHPFDRTRWVSMPIRSLGALRLDCVKPEDPETFTFRLSHVLGHAVSLRDLTLAIPDALLPPVLTACSQRLVGLTLHSPHPSDALLQLSCARWPKLARLSLVSRHVGTGPPPEQLQKPEGKLHMPMLATVHLDISKLPTYFLDHIAQAAPSLFLLHINFNAIQGGYPENQLPHHLDGFRAPRLRQLTLGGKFPMRSLLEMWPYSPNLNELVLADQDMEQYVSLMVVWTKFPRIAQLGIRKLKLVGLHETVLHLSRFHSLTKLRLGHNVVFATMADSAVLTPPVPSQGLPVIKSLKVLEANVTPALAIAARAPALERVKIHSPSVAGAVSHDVPIEHPLSKFVAGLPTSPASSTPSSSTSSLATTTTAAAAANPSGASSPSRVGPSELASLVMPPTGRAPMTLNLYGLGSKVSVLDPSIVQLAYSRPPPPEFDPQDPYGFNQPNKRLYSPWPMTELSIHTTLLPFLSPTTLLPLPVSTVLTSLTLHSVGSRWTRKSKSGPRHSGSSSRPIDRAPFAIPPPDAFPSLKTLKFVGTITATEPPLRLGPSVIALAWDVSRRPEGKVTIEGSVVLCRAALDHGGASILDLPVPLRSSERQSVRWLRRVTLVSPMITQVHLRVPAYPWLAPGEYSIMWSDEREAAETESLCAWIRKVAVWASKCHLYVHLPRGMRLKGITPATPQSVAGMAAGSGSQLVSAGGGTSPVVGNSKGKKKASGASDAPVVESVAVLGATSAQVKFVPYDR
ncbi:hypothetical protein BCR44DRAFT_1000167 [Catenaria anguillulae PL171]|uniref:Uncharacterized protein n=1 Tax=Catenaria anguillulae PL171 TaxID=765915 RepID=A0A1Y2I2P6_9FUNG|nr:hypothetical protein BCR44DRAFT_1000167 [Catenaria anguillulae PL171]